MKCTQTAPMDVSRPCPSGNWECRFSRGAGNHKSTCASCKVIEDRNKRSDLLRRMKRCWESADDTYNVPWQAEMQGFMDEIEGLEG